MPMLRFIAGPGLFLCTGLIATGMACGQSYPNKAVPIRLITSEIGSGSDFMARLIAQGVISTLGQPMVVDNRGIVGIDQASKAAPDGYTLLVQGSTLWIAPLLRTVAYDPVKDFATITLIGRSPNILAVNPSLPVKSVRELIALAKSRPEELNYGSGPTGGVNHLAAELFNAMAGVKITRVNYKGQDSAVKALITGEIQLMFANASSAVPHAKSGRVRSLAVTSSQPSALAPDLPSVASSGLPGYEAEAKVGLFAPGKTPQPVVDKLNEEIVRVVNMPEIKEKFLASGVEVAGSSPEQLTAMIKSEMTRMGKLIKDAGIRAE